MILFQNRLHLLHATNRKLGNVRQVCLIRVAREVWRVCISLSLFFCGHRRPGQISFCQRALLDLARSWPWSSSALWQSVGMLATPIHQQHRTQNHPTLEDLTLIVISIHSCFPLPPSTVSVWSTVCLSSLIVGYRCGAACDLVSRVECPTIC